MIRTLVFFTAGGFFTACYSNAVRRYPVFRSNLIHVFSYRLLSCVILCIRISSLLYAEPLIHVTCTFVGFTLGYIFHKYEEGSEERFQRLIKNHPNAPVTQLK